MTMRRLVLWVSLAVGALLTVMIEKSRGRKVDWLVSRIRGQRLVEPGPSGDRVNRDGWVAILVAGAIVIAVETANGNDVNGVALLAAALLTGISARPVNP